MHTTERSIIFTPTSHACKTTFFIETHTNTEKPKRYE